MEEAFILVQSISVISNHCCCCFSLFNENAHKPKRKWSESQYQQYVIVFLSSQNCEQWAGVHVIIQSLFPIKPSGW